MTNKQKQCLLAYLGYYTGAIDGIWGDMSRAATEAFQRDYQLTADGVFGDATAQRIREVIASGEQPIQQPQSATETGGGESWWKDIQYFTRDEFRCPCGNCGGFPVEPDEAIVREMDRMREYFGTAVIVVPPDGHSGGSGVRCAAYNATLAGSSPNSTHLQGKAADFSIPGVSAEAIKTYLAGRQSAGAIKYWYQITPTAFHANV